MSKFVVIRMNESSVDVCHLNVHKTDIQILEEFNIPFSNKILNDNGINEVDNVGYRIGKELKQHKISTKKAIFTINSPGILGRKVSVPKQKNNKEFLELLSAKVQTDNLFPIALDDYYITYSVIGSHTQKEGEIMPVIDGVLPTEEETETKQRVIEEYAEAERMDAEESDDSDSNALDGSDEYNELAKEAKQRKKKKKEQKEKREKIAFAVNNKTVTVIDCMSYICAKTMVDNIVTVAANARLNIVNIEYGGNSIYQYVKKFVNISDVTNRPKSSDYILVHVSDNNTIISVIDDGYIAQQKSMSFCYEDVCDKFYAQESIFHLTNPDEIFDFINRADFLDRESDFYAKEFPDVDFDSSNGRLIKQTIESVQSEVIDSVITLIDQMNAFVAQCRVDNIRPELIYYYNERSNFPDIVESLIHNIKLDIVPVEPTDDVKNLITYSSVLNPIDFSLALNTDKAMNKKTSQIIIAEGVIAVWAVALIVGYYAMTLENVKSRNTQLTQQISEATEARLIYNRYLESVTTNETVKQFDSIISNNLSNFDELLNAIETAVPVNKCKILQLTASSEFIMIDVEADRKATVVKFIQGLEDVGYFESVLCTDMAETEEDDTFSSNHKVSATITLGLPFTEEITEEEYVTDDTAVNESEESEELEGID